MKLQIGKTLDRLVKTQGLTMRELAKRSGIPASTLGEWKLNRTPKNPEQILKVANALNVSIHYLLFGEEDSKEPLQKLIKEDLFQGTFEITLKRVKLDSK